VSVGNDVVDLADPETRLDGLHPRWVERVFTGTERGALERASDVRVPGSGGATSDRHRLHWALWAAKESAYKARRRADETTVFSPCEFVVALGPLPRGDGLAMGRVVHRGHTFALEVRLDGACLHGVATNADSGAAPVLTRVAFAGIEPGADARRLAAAGIGSALGLDVRDLRIAARPPVILHRGRQLDAILSLSHHGRFAAVAWAIPGN
jgi:hypothetical protein